MHFLSMKEENSTAYKNFQDLIWLEGKLVSIRVVSAYFDIPSINQLLKYMNNQKHERANIELIIIVDNFSSKFQANKELREELKKINNKIQSLCPNSENSGIYLARVGSLFHSKGFLVSTSKRGKFMIGSLNLTQKGLHKNEEIILLGEYTKHSKEKNAVLAKSFNDYVDQLLKLKPYEDEVDRNVKKVGTVERVDTIDVKSVVAPRSLREVFLNGRLYYERKEQDPFRFDLKMPKSMKLSPSHLSAYLESTTSNSIDISKLVADQTTLPEPAQSRSTWKKFCVDTCYGYWSPTAYFESGAGEDCLAEQLRKRKGNRDEYYEQLFEYVKDCSEEVFSALNNIVTEIGDNAKKDSSNNAEEWVFQDVDQLKKAWETWLVNLTRKMENEHFKDRLNSGISSVSVPDIWEDTESTKEFEDSFFESIEYSLRKSSRDTDNYPAYDIRENLKEETGEVLAIDSIREKMELFLSIEGCENLFTSV